MEREYELFEQLPDGSTIWRAHASGLPNVRLKLQEIAGKTTNQCFAMYFPTKEIVARLNVAASRGAAVKPLVFQIAYDDKQASARTAALRLHGYEVVSAIGNEAAKIILSMHQRCDLFIVGDAAPGQTREEMVAWLKVKNPGVQILALNPPRIPELAGADYNVKLNGPETWLPVIASALGGHQHGESPGR